MVLDNVSCLQYNYDIETIFDFRTCIYTSYFFIFKCYLSNEILNLNPNSYLPHPILDNEIDCLKKKIDFSSK